MPNQTTRVALVTGASKGIGAETAIALAQAGYAVGVNYLSDAAGADHTVQACREAGVQAIAIQADVSDRAAVANMFKTCDTELGAVSCLVNNAGIIGGSATLDAVSESQISAAFATNVFGAFYCLQEAVTRMKRAQGSVIINMSSVAATMGSPGEYVHYAASKGAVETMTIGAAKELGADGIRVAGIRVGTTNTEIHQREGNPDRPAKVAAMTPLGRVAEPCDLADAVVWLASEKASFVSGTILTVAGGLAT